MVMPPRSEDQPSPTTSGPTRRSLLIGAAASLVIAGCSNTSQPGSSGSDDVAAPSPTNANTSTTSTTPPTTTTEPVACVLTPELTAGPYYLDGPLARKDIAEGRPGSPLEFRVRVLALPDCTPLADAAVDVWHCDAGGEYSGWNGNSLAETNAQGRNDDRYLRGVQLTDDDGVATFTTIFPGWYEGRTVHIHLKVLEGGAIAKTYEGGHVAHVGQAFFDEDATAAILGESPYDAHTGKRTTNAEDSIFAQAGPGATASLTTVSGKPRDGHVAVLTCLVDPSATPPPAPLF